MPRTDMRTPASASTSTSVSSSKYEDVSQKVEVNPRNYSVSEQKRSTSDLKAKPVSENDLSVLSNKDKSDSFIKQKEVKKSINERSGSINNKQSPQISQSNGSKSSRGIAPSNPLVMSVAKTQSEINSASKQKLTLKQGIHSDRVPESVYKSIQATPSNSDVDDFLQLESRAFTQSESNQKLSDLVKVDALLR